ncbi:HelD family protein [Austwickia chelonae]|uniref:HelD family protein n=1 Tax=Austwickia chelonae TaxID=100225 RepID=UPI001F07F377|nr:AAA family ATPase [Austwickia chelonae]
MPMTADLRAEQNHVVHARAQLQRMRAQLNSLNVQAADRISAEQIASALDRRARSLTDDGYSTLFFGRLDLDQDHPVAADSPRLYIGRLHIGDENGDPVVIDWRTTVARAYYRASRDEPMGVRVRRRFGTEHGRITAIEEEQLTEPSQDTGPSQILADEIERPRVGPMRDIVATIQPEQDELVRVDASRTICVQGAPGTGKTAVGLHRAAWLLFAFREQLSRQGVLVVGPNRVFLQHVSAVLPMLGEVDVRHTTVEDLVGADAGVKVRGTDPVERAVLKGDPRMAEVLRRMVWAHLSRPAEALRVPRGASVWRVSADEVADSMSVLSERGVRYEAGRVLLAHRLAHRVLVRMEAAGGMPDDRVQDAVARSAPIRAMVKQCWPTLTPAAVVHALLSDPAALSSAAEGLLTEEEQRILLWKKPPARPGSARWSAADAVLLDEVRDLLERTPSLGHVILDEAQDLSPMQLRAVGRRCSTGAATVLGDIAQGTTPWATSSWAEAMQHLGHPDAHVEELTRGFRVPSAVIDFAALLLPAIAPELHPPVSVRAHGGSLSVIAIAPDADDLWAVSAEQVVSACRQPGTVGVIVAPSSVTSAAEALTAVGVEHTVAGAGPEAAVSPRVSIIPSTLAKGLEFDTVVAVEPAEVVAAEPEQRVGLRRLYVVLTRAVSQLVVVHSAPLPAELG